VKESDPRRTRKRERKRKKKRKRNRKKKKKMEGDVEEHMNAMEVLCVDTSVEINQNIDHVRTPGSKYQASHRKYDP